MTKNPESSWFTILFLYIVGITLLIYAFNKNRKKLSSLSEIKIYGGAFCSILYALIFTYLKIVGKV